MLAYVVRRLVASVPVLFGVTILAFLMLHLMPGDPVRVLMTSYEAQSGEEERERIRTKFGLNDPLPVQYWKFVERAAAGDLGTSILKGRPVTRMILEALPNTIQLAAVAVCFGALLGIGLGIVAATHHNSPIDSGSILASLFAISMPDFWFAILAVLVVSVFLGWLPSGGSGTWQQLVLPGVVLGSRLAAAVARLTRSMMLEVLSKQYILSARAKGLTQIRVVTRHALKNALIPVVTLIGLDIGRLLGGTVVVETIFSRQGIGKLLIDSILDKDFSVLQGTVLFVATGYVVINLVVDLSYGWLDPRIRYS